MRYAVCDFSGRERVDDMDVDRIGMRGIAVVIERKIDPEVQSTNTR